MQGKIKNTKIGKESSVNMAKFKYLGTTIIHRNFIHEEIRANALMLGTC
jgi:hypothetical protein